MSPGRHRRPRRFVVWGRALSGAVGGSLGRLFRSSQKARLAALDAEVVALRVTVAQMREAVAAAEATATTLAFDLTATRGELSATREQLATTRDQLTAPAHGPAAMPVADPPVALELPLVRLALARTAGRTLDREMAAALASADRSPDTARTEIVLSDLPERTLLDPATDRGSEPADPAAEVAAAATTADAGSAGRETRRIA
ncbi:MAG TPA: hypothetical protein VK640_07480 [Actinomycetes bacterium]|nr:hypothetical protein [Actinomycetes bacterium]